MKKFIAHIRNCVFKGLLAIIPILLCVFAVELLYHLIDKRIMGFLDKFFDLRQIPGLGIILVLACLYLIGLVFSNIVGYQFFKFLEGLSQRIPLIKTIYGVGKQLSDSLSSLDQEKKAFKKAVLVKLGGDGLMIPAFVMNSLVNSKTKEEYFFVLVPTAPTPASGFVMVVKASQTIDPGWSVEECLKAIVSVGIVSPKDIVSN